MSRTSQPRRLDDFEVAIICALRIEADAVEALFDEHYDHLDGKTAPGDPNSYSLGKIHSHNVVLAWMPGMGKVNSAVVAAHFRSSFTQIKLGLVVGICGGVPTTSDDTEILLGDVIISTSLVQYDFGRQYEDRFITKDTLEEGLGQPTQRIRSFLTKLQGLRASRKLNRETYDHLKTLVCQQGFERSRYPGRDFDILHESAYQHKHHSNVECRDCNHDDQACDVSRSSSCPELGCDSRRQIPRSRPRIDDNDETGGPVIHFGRIASGDQVMKSALHRDDIAKAYKLIGFEMEGAGVWNTFPTIVIKGVCDYCDSHKNKDWQRYSSASAAACMKAFLHEWIPSSTTLTSKRYVCIPFTSNPDFTGREDILNRLMQSFGLGVSDTSLRATKRHRVALYGLGGMGKTQIAIRYSDWVRDHCANVSIFWVFAGNTERFRQAYSSIAQKCQIPGHDDPKGDLLSLVKDWLEHKQHDPWLMIIDNADDAEMFLAEPSAGVSRNRRLQWYIPECDHGHILVTTRNKQVGVRLTTNQLTIEVAPMDLEETIQLMAKKLDNAEQEDISALSTTLEHLPLALVQAISFIQENCMTIPAYLQLIAKSDKSLVAMLSQPFEGEGRDSSVPNAVATTWILSFNQIEDQYPDASNLLSLMSFFDRQRIPMDFLVCYCEKLTQSKHGSATDDEETLQFERKIALQKALGVLKAFSFIVEDQLSRDFNMHRLVKIAMHHHLHQKQQMKYWESMALYTVAISYPAWELAYETRIKCEKCLPHAFAVLGFSIPHIMDDQIAKMLLSHKIAEYSFDKSDLEGAEKFATQSVALCERIFSLEHRFRLRILSMLAMIYGERGRLDLAEDTEKQILEINNRLYGPEHPDTLSISRSLASTHRQLGRLDLAEEMHVRTLEISKRVSGLEHQDTIFAMAELAKTYDQQTRFKECEEIGKQALELSRKTFGAEHPYTLVLMGSLAHTYLALGRVHLAEVMQLHVLELKKRVFGPEHRSTINTMDNLLRIYLVQGRSQESEAIAVHVLEIRKKVLGLTHRDTIASMTDLASVWKKKGRMADAQKLLSESIELLKIHLGPEHPDTVMATKRLEKLCSPKDDGND